MPDFLNHEVAVAIIDGFEKLDIQLSPEVDNRVPKKCFGSVLRLDRHAELRRSRVRAPIEGERFH